MRKIAGLTKEKEKSGSRETKGTPSTTIPKLTTTVEQNVKPMVTEAQQVAAKTSVSGRHAVSRGTIFLAFYLWFLLGAIMISLIARYTQFFPGDQTITRNLQKQRHPLLCRLMVAISEPGFPTFGVPLTISIAGIFWALRFRLEAIFILLTSSSNLLNWTVKRLIRRPRPSEDLVTVARVINEPSFPSGHVMHYINWFGFLTYLLATNWRSGKLRNTLITICTSLIALIGPSRVYLGAHWPSDVMAGYIYGGLWFGGVMTIYLRIKAWIHPSAGKTPEAIKPLKQPGEQE
ncbi:MAG TPA: phosphatase PAP2 family protein [Ktedonobacteraceae bacterium]|nr:phosphatase PAP2 family protein [Ktedonobacteraceae bacterium]